MMTNPLFYLKSIFATWQSSSPSLVIDIVFAITCGLVLFLLLLPCLESNSSLPPPGKHRNIRKHAVKLRKESWKNSQSLKVHRSCHQELEEAWGLISRLKSHLGRILDKCDFCQHLCQDASGEMCKAAPTRAHQPRRVPVEETAPAMTALASPAPLTKCPIPLVSALSPGLTASSVSVHLLSPLSASQPPESFLSLDSLLPQPLALSHSLSSPPESEAHSPPPTVSPISLPPESTLTLPPYDSVALPLGTIPQSLPLHTPRLASPIPSPSGPGPSGCLVSGLFWCQAAAKAECFPTSSQHESQQEHQSHHPPEILFLGDPTDKQVEAGSTSLVNADVQKTQEILTTKKAEMGKEKEKKEGSDCHLNSEQDTDNGASHASSPVSTVPGNLISPELQKQLEQHLEKRLTLLQQEHWDGLPCKIQLTLCLTLPDGQLQGVCKAQGEQGPLRLSVFTCKSSQDAEKMRFSCPARMPPRMGLGKDVGHDVGRTLKHQYSGSSSLPEKVLGMNLKESGRDLVKPLSRCLEKGVPRVHLDRKVGQISAGQMLVDAHHSGCPANLSGESNIHREAKDSASPEDPEPSMNTSPVLSALSSCTLQVLETHVRKFQVRHRWGLPLRILKSIKAFKLTKAQGSPLLQSLGICSAFCVPRAHPKATFTRFLEKPVHSLQREKGIAEESIPTLVGPLSAPSLTSEKIQRGLGGNPTGDCHDLSKAPPSRQEGGLPSQPLTYTSESRLWCSDSAIEAEKGLWEPSPNLVVSRNEPTEKSECWTSEKFLQDMTILEFNSESQSSMTQDARETKEAQEFTLKPHVLANLQPINVDLRRSRSLRSRKRPSQPTKLVAPVPGKPCPNAQLSEFEHQGLVEAGNQPQGQATGVLLEDCETGTILQDYAIDALLKDCSSDVLLAADILASHESLFGSQRVSIGDMSASQVLHDLTTSGRSHQQKPLRVQHQHKGQSDILVPTDKKEDNRKPGPGEYREGLAELRVSQASGMHSAQEKESVESLSSKSCQVEQKGQALSENPFKKRTRQFLQWILPKKGQGLKDPPQKVQPAPATAQSWEPGKCRSLTDNRAAEAQALMTAVRQSLCHQRAAYYKRQQRMIRVLAHDQQAPSSGHNSFKSGWTRNRDIKGVFPPREPGSPGRPCQHGLMVTGQSGGPRHCPRHCPLKKYVSSGQPVCAGHAFPARTFL